MASLSFQWRRSMAIPSPIVPYPSSLESPQCYLLSISVYSLHGPGATPLLQAPVNLPRSLQPRAPWLLSPPSPNPFSTLESF